MEIRQFNIQDIENVIPMYIYYFNNIEGDEWTIETTKTRLSQMVNRQDYFGLKVIVDEKIVGFALGNFEQFFDGKVFHLIEIFIDYNYQNKGYGKILMQELEKQVKEEGAFRLTLEAINDEKRNNFYNSIGYKNCDNIIIKCKNLI